VIICVIFGPRDNHQFCITQLQDFWTAGGWIAYLVIILCAALVSHLVNLRYEAAESAGSSLPHAKVILPLSYSLASSLIGSLCVVLSKTMAEVFEIFTQLGMCTLGKWFFWVECVLVALTLCTWLYRLTTALGKYDPVFVIPLIWANYILFSAIGGGIYFQEFRTLSTGRMVGFLAGVAVMLGGLAVLAPATESKVEPADTPKMDKGSKASAAPRLSVGGKEVPAQQLPYEVTL